MSVWKPRVGEVNDHLLGSPRCEWTLLDGIIYHCPPALDGGLNLREFKWTKTYAKTAQTLSGHAVRPDPVRLLSTGGQSGFAERQRRAQLRLPHPGVCQVQHGSYQQRNLCCHVGSHFWPFGGDLQLRLRR
ncbi:hypothetical protein LDENG_00002800 [Lucifuga dentata]|nr:hypothetical protein LDENG_00002800 [Lucifuga dentata]